MHDAKMIEAAQAAGRAEARRILTETADRLERQADLHASNGREAAPLDATAVLSALRAVLAG
ncbi:MAG: hypothetical protein GY913_36100 [Proteobacteria bacterium]|nr:hypothetical protein [Pseudomonadota bacterium]MCP4922354.1 hypothetical protein [Pseudomonadota bacterium]